MVSPTDGKSIVGGGVDSVLSAIDFLAFESAGQDIIPKAQEVGVLGKEESWLFGRAAFGEQIISPEMVWSLYLGQIEDGRSDVELRSDIFSNFQSGKESRVRRKNADEDLCGGDA